MKTTNSMRCLLTGLVLSFCSTLVFADVPRLVHYQGKLREASGAAVTGGFDLRFRLYDAQTGGSTLYDEPHTNVSVANGLFSVLIGSQSGGVPDSVLDGGAAWLGVSVGGGSELSPRARIGSTPYAVKARAAEQLVRPETMTPAVIVDSNGYVGMGSASPSSLLTLGGTSPKVTFDPDAGDGRIKFMEGGASKWEFGYNYPDDSMVWYSWGTGGDVLSLEANGSVGIATLSPDSSAKLDVNGQVRIRGGSPGAGKVLTSDANGLATWQAPSGGGLITAVSDTSGGSNAGVVVDMTGGTITVNPTQSRRFLMGWGALAGSTGTSCGPEVDLLIDGSSAPGLARPRFIPTTSGQSSTISFTYVTDVLSAGSHTFKLQWYRACNPCCSGNGTLGGGRFWVRELD